MTNPQAKDWPVLVTGAGGFVGGHIARMLAADGHKVRGLVRRIPVTEPSDPFIEWHVGDLLDRQSILAAVRGVRAVIHSAAWVNLGYDPNGLSQRVNVDGTRVLLEAAAEARVDRFVNTSTLWTIATGTADSPANEDSTWNLDTIRCPYEETKREAERIVLDGVNGRIQTISLSPGMVIGPRDPKLTSSTLLLLLATCPLAVLPGGGLPMIDVHVLAKAHCQAITLGEPGRRYAVIGNYCSFVDLARMVRAIAGRPWLVGKYPDFLELPFTAVAKAMDRWILRGRRTEVSAGSMAGGFLKLHVSGDRANQIFGLQHPDLESSVREALLDLQQRGRSRWLRIQPKGEGMPGKSC